MKHFVQIAVSLLIILMICVLLSAAQEATPIDEHQQQAETYWTKAAQKTNVAIYLSNIGLVYKTLGQYDKALDYFEQALEIDRRLDRETDIANRLNNIGAVHYNQQNYLEAITHFVESVELKERLRKTVAGDVRREYLASQIYTYRFLTSCYVRTGDFAKAFEIIELSRAKLLRERLADSDEVPLPSLDQIQQTLPDDMAVLLYAKTVDENIVQMLITTDHVTASEHSIREGVHSDFETLITQYRAQLVNPSFSRGLNLPARDVSIRQEDPTDAMLSNLSNTLYAFLLEHFQEDLHGKTRLLILPDGILNFLPFETLKDEQGEYLIEKYQITYAQSLGVLELISQRQYAQDRHPLLAFGGAVYEEQTYQEDMIENEAQLTYLHKQVDLALKRGSSLQEFYAQLGRGNWENLPGTLMEVQAIQDVVDNAELVTGEDVNEAAIKKLSADGELATYKVLHFAAHGDANPRIPELSALVLSLTPGSAGISPASDGSAGVSPALEVNNRSMLPGAGETPALPGEEDGYLRAGEIVNLDIKADFVNLSACETGLGKLYSGEGVVGLTQAFLLAGANGLSVSLWSVADESTAQFMVALYTLVEEAGLSYAEAITDVKRRFIHGDFGKALKTPYFWAPFVYYGK